MNGEEQVWENREEGGKSGQPSIGTLLVLTASGKSRRNPLGLEVLHIWLLLNICHLNDSLNRVLSFLCYPNALLFMISRISADTGCMFSSLCFLSGGKKPSLLGFLLFPNIIEGWEPQTNFIIGWKCRIRKIICRKTK